MFSAAWLTVNAMALGPSALADATKPVFAENISFVQWLR
jgi:hypothetical protein